MDERTALARRYRSFAQQQARGSSPTLEAWATALAADPDLLARVAGLPAGKQQPNLVFAAARRHGAVAGDAASLRHALLDGWDEVRSTILQRSTQTNEPARCAVLLPVLHRIAGPIALIELGAAAGMCLVPDRYSYRYSDGTVVDPPSGPSPVVIDCVVAGGTLPSDLATPEIVWRAGLDLNPLDPADPDTAAWLDVLVWPEHELRRRRLRAALALAAACPVRIERADLVDGVRGLIDAAPAGATVVVQHSATFAYLDEPARAAATNAIDAAGARRLSFEGRGVVSTEAVPAAIDPTTLFVAALDREPIALADGHAGAITLLG